MCFQELGFVCPNCHTDGSLYLWETGNIYTHPGGEVITEEDDVLGLVCWGCDWKVPPGDLPGDINERVRG